MQLYQTRQLPTQFWYKHAHCMLNKIPTLTVCQYHRLTFHWSDGLNPGQALCSVKCIVIVKIGKININHMLEMKI